MINDLTKGNPARVIFLYSLPVIIGNVFQQLYNWVDSVIIGRSVSFEALAGVGVTNGMTFLVMGFILGITSGFGIKVSQRFGAGDMDGVRRSIAVSIVLSTLVALVLTVVALALAGPVLRWIGADEDIYIYAHDYLTVIFLGIITQTAYNLVACILRSLGDSRTPLYFLIFSSLVNVGLDLLFVCSFGWSVTGAALATVISQLLSAVLCFAYAFRRYDQIRLGAGDFRLDMASCREHMAQGLPMAFQFSITGLGLVFLNCALAGFPAQYIAGYAAGNKTTNVLMLVPVSFGAAMAGYAGQNFGAGRLDRIRSGVRASTWMSMAVCALACFVMLVFPHQLTSMFVDPDFEGDASAIYEASTLYLRACSAFFPFLFMIFIFRNALQGVGRTFWPLMAGVGELVARAVASLTLPLWLGYTGVIFIDASAWIVASVMLAVAYASWVRRPSTPLR